MQTARQLARKKPEKSSKPRLAVVPAARKQTRPARRVTSSAASFYKFMACVVVLSALAMVNLSQRVLIAQSGLEISNLQREIKAARTERQQLEMSLLVLESPGRIQRQAMSRLRMIQPERVSYMQVPLSKRESGSILVADRVPIESGASKQGIIGGLLEKVAGQVQLLPLGNLGTPIE